MALSIRELSPDDIPRLVVLNAAAVPAVPATSGDEFARLLEASDLAIGIGDDGENGEAPDVPELLGFVIGMNPGSDYASENYRYFQSRGTDFLYVDRIIVDTEARGRRIGQRLYEHVFGIAATDGRAEVTCEVNVVPPNPRSLAFHERLGFTEVGRQSTKGGAVQVALLAAPVDRSPRW